MVIAVFINDEGSECYLWADDYFSEYSEEEKAKYHTIIVYDEERNEKLYEKINGKVLLSKDE